MNIQRIKQISLSLMITYSIIASGCGDDSTGKCVGENCAHDANQRQNTPSQTHVETPTDPNQTTEPEKTKEPEKTETPEDPKGPENPKNPPKPETCTLEGQVLGRFWIDERNQSISDYSQAVEDPEAEDVNGLANSKVTIYLPNGEKHETKTCSNGWFVFDQLGDSELGVINYHRKDCTTANCPINFASHIPTNDIKLVTFGDSIPSYPPKPSANGDSTWFPERLQTLISPIAQIENVNVAVPGSTSSQWLPDSNYFRNKLAVQSDATTFLFSIGGNDLFSVRNDIANTMDISKIMNKIDAIISNIITNIKSIVSALRKQSPDADIIWISYMNYGRASEFSKHVPAAYRPIVENVVSAKIQSVIKDLTGYRGLMIVDMFSLTEIENSEGQKFDIDAILWDELHLNATGHQFFAEQVFKLLGGWRANPTIGERRYLGFLSE